MQNIYLRGGQLSKSKFDYSLLEPIENENSFNTSLLEPVEEEQAQIQPFNAPQKEPISTWLPRDIAIGLLKQGHRYANLPYESAKDINKFGLGIPEAVKKQFPVEQYFNKKEPSYFEKLAGQFNKENNVPEELQNPNWGLNVENIPHLPEYNYAEMLGQKDNGSMLDQLIQGGVNYAPELLSLGKLAKHFTPERLKELFFSRRLNKENLMNKEGLERVENEIPNIDEQINTEAQNAQSLQNTANKEVGEYLNKGYAHSTRGASALSHRLNNIESYWKNAYKDLKNNLKTSEFQMENMPEYEQDIAHAIKNIKDLEIVNGKLTIRNRPEMSSEMQSIVAKAPTPSDTTAEQFLTKYQDFRDARYDLLKRAKTAETAAERKALFDAYKESKPLEESVSKALSEGLGEYKPEFQRINEGYSKQIYPLRNNKVAQKALSGKLGANTIADLEGFGEGNELVRELIKQDPELLRNIVGQRYAAKPEGLKDISEASAEYLYEMPELKKIMAEHETKINNQLEKVNELKNKKEITLKQKIDYENKAKELKNRLRRINADKAKIWRGTKRAAKYGTALYLGGSALKQIFGK